MSNNIKIPAVESPDLISKIWNFIAKFLRATNMHGVMIHVHCLCTQKIIDIGKKNSKIYVKINRRFFRVLHTQPNLHFQSLSTMFSFGGDKKYKENVSQLLYIDLQVTINR